MYRKFQVAITVLLLSCFTLAEAAADRTWTPGVSKGDYFYYEMYGVYTSSNPNAVIEVPPFERNTTDWVRVDVTGVSGSIVYQVYTEHFKNGTEIKTDWQTNLDPNSSGVFDIREKGIPICAANLAVGDPLPTVQLWINETVTKSYSFGTRVTNYVSWNYTEDWGYCYFDQPTGVLLELNRTHQYVNALAGETISKTDVINLTSSNLWQTQEPPNLFLPLLIIAVVSAGVLLYAIKVKQAKQRQQGLVKKP